ncbi:MAG: glucuronate isomerase [Verrucomicrobiae bacterium]|nr:glucuronate isomerase [Verrucomicrobiae bacterium]
MRPFIHDDFLLRSEMARRLYHGVAEGLPIIDFHNHLDAGDLADDRVYENLARLWVLNDPYKHRAMRIAGVPERFITGDASDGEKFDAWAATVPQTLGNPLFHWTALELKRYFGIDELLSSESAGPIWDKCNAMLRDPSYSARGLIGRSSVECLCTSDRPGDDLAAHARLAGSPITRWPLSAASGADKNIRVTRVLPSLRVDGVDGDEAGAVVGCLDHFERMGCRLADHAVTAFDSGALRVLGREYGRRGWILQLHIGAQRETSTRLRALAGPAGGYATIGDRCDIAGLCRFLDDLERDGCLPRTVLYPLNPADYAALATLTGSFAEDGVRGKIQLGPAWWYNDHALGIRQHLDALAHHGLLSAFIGMTTDSRSPLSMVRHEYFRRVLCDGWGEKVERGEMPGDEGMVGELVRAVCHGNAREWSADRPRAAMCEPTKFSRQPCQ